MLHAARREEHTEGLEETASFPAGEQAAVSRGGGDGRSRAAYAPALRSLDHQARSPGFILQAEGAV